MKQGLRKELLQDHKKGEMEKKAEEDQKQNQESQGGGQTRDIAESAKAEKEKCTPKQNLGG